ncbi:MAG TPA: methyltransferase domain-containing protein [Bryobacteraceae bacterium]|nr:methyltransferase domain-containing protein [Bryobacteraceae bacterium]
MVNICLGKDAREMRVLEIGRGAGRVTCALAKVFGEVHAVDVSGEMVKLAAAATASLPNAFVYQDNGRPAAPRLPVQV